MTVERDLILLCCDDGSGRLYGIPNDPASPLIEVGKLIEHGKPVHDGPVRTAAWWRNAGTLPTVILVALASDDHTASLWQIDKEETKLERTSEQEKKPEPPAQVKLLGVARGHTGPVRHVALSDDGRFLATGSDDKSVRVWKIPELKSSESPPPLSPPKKND